MNLNQSVYSGTKYKLTTMGASVLSLCALSLVSVAAEYTVETSKFEQSITLDAVAMPSKSFKISIQPKAWKTFKIEKVLTQGSVVKKGDPLIWIDTESLDEAIQKTKKSRVVQKLQLDAAKQSLAELEVNTPISLKSAQRKFDYFKENYDYYKSTLRPNTLERASYSKKRANDSLKYQKEELKQLNLMYKEDGLTEQTEEIILERAKNGVADSERSLKNTLRSVKYTLEVDVPRKDLDWENNLVKETNSLESSKKSLQRKLEIKREETAKLIKDDEKKQEYLDDLISDRELMNITAPADGVVHYGEFKRGKWLTDRARKVLYKGGSVPADSNVMSIVPEGVKYQFNAFLKESEKQIFSVDKPANLKLSANPWVSYNVAALPTDLYPNLQHQWLVTFNAVNTFPEGIVAGSKAKVTVITAIDDHVILIPKKAIKSNTNGTFSVMRKMAEGDPQKTVIKIGRQSGDKVEITDGVEVGQVIITP